MARLDLWISKLRRLCASNAADGPDFDKEVENHITMLAEKFVRQGMTPGQARHAARVRFGNVLTLKEERNEMRTFVWLETTLQDLRYGARAMSRQKAFAAVAILTLALGIGVNTAIFSVVNAVVLRPMPYPDPSRLVVLWGNVKRVKVERRGASYPDYVDWRDQSHSFEAMAAFDSGPLALTGVDAPDRIPAEYVSQPYLSLLGIRPEVGRFFLPEEDRVPQRDAVVVLSDASWRQRFGADPNIIGRKIQLEGHACAIVGVAPSGFRGLSDRAELWIPFMMTGSAEDFKERGNRGFQVLARLKQGVSLGQAQAEMDGISKRLERAYPDTNEARGVEVSPVEKEMFGDIRKPLFVLLAAVGFVLLIACTNVANLLLARSETRQREIAMRRALGAGHGRIVRQLLAESAVLVLAGCAAGLVIAHYGTRALMAASPVTFPSYIHPAIDFRVAMFAVVVCCAAGLLLGIVPAIHSGRIAADAQKQGSARTLDSRRGRTFRNTLVVAEVAFSTLLLIGAGLMMRTLERITALDPGYDPLRLLTLRVSLPRLEPAAGARPPDAPSNPDAKAVVTANDILQKVSTIPSVTSASMATDVPLGESNAVFYAAEGQSAMNAHNMPRAYFHRISPAFFSTLRTRFVAGRPFTQEEVRDNANVAIVTENMVKRFWPGQDPIGKRIKVGGLTSKRPWLAIVGVVPELKYRGLPENPTADPDLFQVFNERTRGFAMLVRTSLDAAAITSSVRAALRQTEPSILIYNTAMMQDLIGAETARPRFMSWLMAVFAMLALLLAAIGIYGVMSYTVSARTREIGLRMALGADRGGVLRMVVGRGMGLIGGGLAAGTVAALALTRAIDSLLYGVSSTDPLTFAAATLVLALASLIACSMPAARASRIDPAVALRNE